MVLRRRPPPPADPLAGLVAPWRAAAERAVAAGARFDAAVAGAASGPMRERLGGLAATVGETVQAAIAMAHRAQALEQAVSDGEIEAVGARLKDARRRGAADEVELLSRQFASLNRLMNSRDELVGALDRLGLRIEAAVAHALELTLLPAGDDPAGRIAGVLDELTALQAAMAELA